MNCTKRTINKKGFTLVELVIVIAILGVLAAIAVPAVVGIINNAQKSSREANASELTQAIKNLYSGVVSGQINQSTDPSDLNGLDPAILPPKNATVALCKEMAKNNLSVKTAIEYAGLDSKFDEHNISDYVFDGGIVYYVDSYTGENGTAMELYIGIASVLGLD